MGKHLLKTVMAVTLIGAAAYCLKRFSDELVVYVSPDDAPATKILGLTFSLNIRRCFVIVTV